MIERLSASQADASGTASAAARPGNTRSRGSQKLALARGDDGRFTFSIQG